MFTKFNLRDYNFKLFFTIIAALIFGTVAVSSADSSYTQRQIVGVIAGICVMIFVSFVNYDFIAKFYKLIWLVNIILLALVLVPGIGVNVNNATRWLLVGGANGVQFQPSEFSKIFLIIFTAVYLDKHKSKEGINNFKCLAFLAVYLGAGLLLIVVEPDLSTTICITLIMLTIIYVAGLSYKIIGIAMLVFIPCAGSFLWYIQNTEHRLLKDYQVNRILDFLYGKSDNLSQQNNSIMAIGSGQLTGKGLNTSTIATVKDANFISEQQTDFIFSVIGEEVGFIGSVILIAIILFLVLQCIHIAREAKDLKGCLIVTGMAVLIAYQSFINIGVATGVLPNTGIPLPFISYGQSSLLSVCAGMGIVLNVSIQRNKFD